MNCFRKRRKYVELNSVPNSVPCWRNNSNKTNNYGAATKTQLPSMKTRVTVDTVMLVLMSLSLKTTLPPQTRLQNISLVNAKPTRSWSCVIFTTIVRRVVHRLRPAIEDYHHSWWMWLCTLIRRIYRNSQLAYQIHWSFKVGSCGLINV